MPASLISFMTAASWIARLGKIYAKGSKTRSEEIDAIANVFGDPEQLAPLYVPPDCLEGNPADRDEDDDMARPSRPLFEIVEDFFARDIKKRDGRRHLFLLADAGMGKTSSLMMLKLAHLNKFWPGDYDCQLFKLGPDTLDRVAEIESQRKTILLLDALDEDSKIIDIGVTDRLLELIARTVNFHRVVITCRTQFFPGVVERPGKIRVADSYICQSLYLAPFSDAQVEEYLKKRFPSRWRHWLTGRESPERQSARSLAFSIRSLRTRPMLLNHVEDLKEKHFRPDDEFGVYYHLVQEWLRREERKSIERRVDDPDFPELPLAELFHACAKIAIWMQCRGLRLIKRESLESLIAGDPLVAHIQFVDIGGRSLLNRTAEGDYRFSHYSIQEFLVVFAALTGNLAGDEQPHGTIQMVRFVRSGLQYPRSDHKQPTLRALRLHHLPLDTIPLRAPLNALVRPGGQGVNLIRADLSTSQLPGWDLKSAFLIGADLRCTNLTEADLRHADLRGAYLFKVVFDGANLGNADLRGANMSDASFVRADLRGADLTDAVLVNIALDGANLDSAILDGADLSRMSLSGIKLQRASIENANLMNADLKQANLTGANLTGANLVRANLPSADLTAANLEGADLRGAGLRVAVLERATLEETNLRHADLTNAILHDVDLTRAIISRANFSGVDLSGCDLSGTDLTGAILAGAILASANLGGAILVQSNLTGADLSDANLSRAEFSARQAYDEGESLMPADFRHSLNDLGHFDDSLNPLLEHTSLRGANLQRANLENAFLAGVDLSFADLSFADLSFADLSFADLSFANLRDANLAEANLKGVSLKFADLTRTNFKGATLTAEQLAHVEKVKGMTMPDGNEIG